MCKKEQIAINLSHQRAKKLFGLLKNWWGNHKFGIQEELFGNWFIYMEVSANDNTTHKAVRMWLSGIVYALDNKLSW